MKTIIAVDLDGTLAEYDGWRGPNHIGAPISAMVSRVKQWLACGFEVMIFTARLGEDRPDAADIIKDWLEQSCGLPRLHVTNIKRRDFSVIYDDRCVQVEPNTGRIVTQRVWELAGELSRITDSR